MGNRMSLQEQMRQNKRVINKAIREIDRERVALEREQQRLERDIKKLAKQNEMAALRVLAKDLVRTKQYISKFHVMKSNLQSLSLKMQTMKTTHEMGLAMGKMTKAMKRMNKKMNVQTINKLVMEFEREGQKQEMNAEMMEDAIDMAFEGDQTEEEEDAIVNQVLEEIGVNTMNEFQAAPTNSIKQADANPVAAEPVAADGGGGGGESDAAVSDLEARLNNLRRGN